MVPALKKHSFADMIHIVSFIDVLLIFVSLVKPLLQVLGCLTKRPSPGFFLPIIGEVTNGKKLLSRPTHGRQRSSVATVDLSWQTCVQDYFLATHCCLASPEEAGGKIDSHQCPSVLATLRLDAFVMDFILEGKKPRLRLGNSRKTVSWLLIARNPWRTWMWNWLPSVNSSFPCVVPSWLLWTRCIYDGLYWGKIGPASDWDT